MVIGASSPTTMPLPRTLWGPLAVWGILAAVLMFLGRGEWTKVLDIWVMRDIRQPISVLPTRERGEGFFFPF
jgi:hypothetical protein